jgi:hypothetical protein
MKSLKIAFAFLCLVFVITSCDKKVQTNPAVVSNQHLEALELMGFKSETAEMMPDGNIVVEGDILFSLNTLEDVMNKMNRETTSDGLDVSDRQISVVKTSAIPIGTSSSLTFRILSGFTPAQMTAIRAGVASWVSPTRNRISFTEVAATSPAMFTFVLNNTLTVNGFPAFGASTFPTGTTPASTISLNMALTGTSCTVVIGTCIGNLVSHELGHALGFHHLIETGETQIIETPTADATSIMNDGNTAGGMAGLGLLPGPNLNDLNMSSALYPNGGLALTLSSVGYTNWNIDPSFCFINVGYTQPVGRCYSVRMEILQNGVVIKSRIIDIGVATTGTCTSKFDLPIGQYQVRLIGINYRGDFTQMGTSNTLNFTRGL